MKRLSQTTQFARDVKRMRKRGKDLGKLMAVVRRLAAGEPLDPRHQDHPLIGLIGLIGLMGAIGGIQGRIPFCECPCLIL